MAERGICVVVPEVVHQRVGGVARLCETVEEERRAGRLLRLVEQHHDEVFAVFRVAAIRRLPRSGKICERGVAVHAEGTVRKGLACRSIPPGGLVVGCGAGKTGWCPLHGEPFVQTAAPAVVRRHPVGEIAVVGIHVAGGETAALLQIVQTLDGARPLPRRRQRRQQHGGEDCNDRNYYQQFNQSEIFSPVRGQDFCRMHRVSPS